MYAPFVDTSFLFAIFLLLRVRRGRPLRDYIIVSLLLLSIYFAFSVVYPRIYISRSDWFESRALVPAVLCLVLVCAVRPFIVWRFFQPVVAFLLTQYFLSDTYTIA